DDVRLCRPGPARVGRENASTSRRDHLGFLGSEKAQRHPHCAVLRLYAYRLARQRVQQRAAHGGGRERQKFSAFHISFSGCLKYRSVIASVAQYVSASTVKVGLGPAFCGKEDAPITNRFGKSQCWR